MNMVSWPSKSLPALSLSVPPLSLDIKPLQGGFSGCPKEAAAINRQQDYSLRTAEREKNTCEERESCHSDGLLIWFNLQSLPASGITGHLFKELLCYHKRATPLWFPFYYFFNTVNYPSWYCSPRTQIKLHISLPFPDEHFYHVIAQNCVITVVPVCISAWQRKWRGRI